MRAVEAFSVKMSKMVMKAASATIFKAVMLAPFSSRNEERMKQLKPTRLSLAISLG